MKAPAKKGLGVIITIHILTFLYPQCLKIFDMHYETPCIQIIKLETSILKLNNVIGFFIQGEHTSSREKVSGNWMTSEWEQKMSSRFLRLHSGWIAQTMTWTILQRSQSIRKSGKTRKRFLSHQAQPRLLQMCSHWFYYCYIIYY